MTGKWDTNYEEEGSIKQRRKEDAARFYFSISAIYLGDGNFTGSTSAAPNLTLTVYTRMATIPVSSSLNQIVQAPR